MFSFTIIPSIHFSFLHIDSHRVRPSIQRFFRSESLNKRSVCTLARQVTLGNSTKCQIRVRNYSVFHKAPSFKVALHNPKNMKRLLAFLIALTFPASSLAACICLDSPPLHIEITSAYPQPLEGESEWVELLNTGETTIDLAFYTLEDATASPMNLEGELAPGESTQITELSFQLNNGSDSLILETIDEIYVHSFNYSESEPGQSVPLPETESEDEESEIIELPTRWPDFSEALPNPEGVDSTEEWIELYNPYNESLELTGLKLDDQEGGSTPYSLSGSIPANDYLIISVEDSGLSLNNSTDEIRLLLNDSELWAIPYADVEEGLSYALVDGAYQWTTPTPGSINVSTNSENNGDLSEEIELTEVQPNPEGPDQDEEWIEITNGGDSSVDLGNWTIDDGPNGSDPYVIPSGTIIEPGETIVFDRPTTGVALNNSHEGVELRDYTGDIIDQIDYESTQEGKSLSKIEVDELQNLQASFNPMGLRTETIWEWTEPTPGESNPRWTELVGLVQNYQEGTLTVLHGNTEYLFDVVDSQFSELLFQPGNTLLVQASIGDGFSRLIRAELLEQVIAPENKAIPWSWISLGILTLAVLGYEWKKHSKENSIFLPHSQALSH